MGNSENEYPSFEDARIAVENMNIAAEEAAATAAEQPAVESAGTNGLPAEPPEEENAAVNATGTESAPANGERQNGDASATAPINEATNNNVPQSEALADAQYQQQLGQMSEQLKAVMEQNANLQQLISEMSQSKENSIIENTMEMPMLDISGMAFDDEDTIKAKQQDYANAMAKYIEDGLMKKIGPYIAEAQEGMREKEKNKIIGGLAEMPELQGINDMLPQMENLMRSNPVFQSDDVSTEDKLITAYALAKGINAIREKPKGPPSTEELMNMYRENTDFRNLIEQERANAVKKNESIPQMASSSGASNAAIHLPQKPKNISEATELVKRMFGN